jgi:hypothetical protein
MDVSSADESDNLSLFMAIDKCRHPLVMRLAVGCAAAAALTGHVI